MKRSFIILITILALSRIVEASDRDHSIASVRRKTIDYTEIYDPGHIEIYNAQDVIKINNERIDYLEKELKRTNRTAFVFFVLSAVLLMF